MTPESPQPNRGSTDTAAMVREEILLRPARRALAFCGVLAALFATGTAASGGDPAADRHDAVVERFVRAT